MVNISRTFWWTDYGEPWNRKDFEKLAAYDVNDTLFSYKAHLLQSSACCFSLCTCALNRVFSWELHVQGIVLAGFAMALGFVLHVSGAMDNILDICTEYDWSCYSEKSIVMFAMTAFGNNVSSLARYVGGLFLSLALAKTYYANRGLLGTVFGETLGLAMMVASNIKPLPGNPKHYLKHVETYSAKDVRKWAKRRGLSTESAKILENNRVTGKNLLEWNEHYLSMLISIGLNAGDATTLIKEATELQKAIQHMESKSEVEKIRREIIRLVNAGFRLLWIEHLGDDTKINEGDYSVLDEMLTVDEWKHIDGIPSRCTYVYSWIADLIWEAREKGYIRCETEAVRMHEFVEKLRAANVWGLPSLPYPYLLWIVIIIKASLFLACLQGSCRFGLYLALSEGDKNWTTEMMWGTGITILDMLLENFMWQGMLDLHAMLRFPNMGKLVGHMPTEIFLSFTKEVCENVIFYIDMAPHRHDGKTKRNSAMRTHSRSVDLHADKLNRILTSRLDPYTFTKDGLLLSPGTSVFDVHRHPLDESEAGVYSEELKGCDVELPDISSDVSIEMYDGSKKSVE